MVYESHKQLKHALIEERLTFSAWLRGQIESCVASKEPKGKRRKGKEG